MDDVFTIPSKYNENIPAEDCEAINLFQECSKTDLSLVIQANKFYYAYGAEYHAENIKWSGEKISNSCSTSLREKILEEVQEFKVSEGQKASFGKGAEKYSSLNIPPAPIISLKSANVGRTGHKL